MSREQTLVSTKMKEREKSNKETKKEWLGKSLHYIYTYMRRN